MTAPYICYFLTNGRKSYIGITNHIARRLRQHRRELVGGARYTTSVTTGRWELRGWISGFLTRREALSFEWHARHCRRREARHPLHPRWVVLSHILADWTHCRLHEC